jgi:hypothetical protein
MGQIKRLELKLPPRSVERLENLVRETGAPTYAEVVRDAIQLYEWIVSQKSNGIEFGLRKPGGSFEPVHLFTDKL